MPVRYPPFVQHFAKHFVQFLTTVLFKYSSPYSKNSCMFYYLEELGKEECDKKNKSILPPSNPLSSSFSLSSFISFIACGTFLPPLLWKYLDKFSSSIMLL